MFILSKDGPSTLVNRRCYLCMPPVRCLYTSLLPAVQEGEKCFCLCGGQVAGAKGPGGRYVQALHWGGAHGLREEVGVQQKHDQDRQAHYQGVLETTGKLKEALERMEGSEDKEEEIGGFLEKHKYFGLDRDQVVVFIHGMKPCLDLEGMMMMKDRGEVCTRL